jgi:hypothetical protein
MKRNNNISWLMVCISICLISCYKDKGNYDYKPLEQVLIDTAKRNIMESYAIIRYDELVINPRIVFNQMEVTSPDQVSGKLTFTWAIYPATTGTQHKRDTISNDVTLRKPISKPAGRWVVILSVKNLLTQVEEYMKFNVQVDEQLSDGWMLLYEKNGNTDVGLIVDDWTKKNVVQSRTFADMLRNSNGAPLLGEPRGLLHSPSTLSTAEVLIASSRDVVAVERSSFQVLYPIDKLFWSFSSGGEIKTISANNGRKEVIIYNNRIHTVNHNNSNSNYRINFFSAAYNGTYGDLAPWSATAFGPGFEAVVYDQTNKKFLNIPAGGTSVRSFDIQASNAPFDVNNVGLDPEAFDWGRGNGTPAVGYEYSVMKNSTERFLLVSNFTNALAPQIAIAKYPITGIPITTPIRTLSSAFGGNYALIGTDRAVYLHRYQQGVSVAAEWQAPLDEDITCVRLQKFYQNPAVAALLLPRPNTVVYIATFNTGTKVGKVYAYVIDQTNGTINKSTERVYTGFGKITDMTYKWSL